MVEKPAWLAGLELEDGLAQAIVDDVLELGIGGAEDRKDEPPAFPSWSVPWKSSGSSGSMAASPHTAFRDLGGVAGSLNQWAMTAYDSLAKAQQVLAQRAFTSLVHPGDDTLGRPDTRRLRELKELSRYPGEEDAVHEVVKRLADARLLVTTTDPMNPDKITVGLIHEALLQNWGQLQTWLKEDREFLAWRSRLEPSLRAWGAGSPTLLPGTETGC